MRSGGFPCRFTPCREIFSATDGSLVALQAASARRTEHEVAVHEYHHRRLDEPERKSPGWNSIAKRPKGA